MRAHQIMTRNVITVGPEARIVEAAKLMLENHVSGLPVIDNTGKLVGIVTEGDFLRRAEIGTQRKRPRWLQFFVGPSRAASEFVHASGRKVEEVMTGEPLTVTEQTSLDEIVRLMEKNGVKRLPVVSGDRLVGIVSRANLVQAVASLARDVPDPTADDDHIRERCTHAILDTDWRPIGLQVTVRDGVVHLHGIIINADARQAAIVAAENVAGVKEVHDHLAFVDTYSGFYVESPEDIKATG
ncbi:CBS domain-containing protein [Bradyrhizobium sp. NP1]|uniref:CBS domain-containing protein n=1 Tax=Bradyrhizobium sp. NP1 TaxID=3049772 RepID=UPI0025A63D83|nr:CBS domain-containing protein [Bradyrhizobium sp. NP1]WJR80187.1 CBS domain-containing protein [Bradyrhizobium sp. NP1]